MDMALSGRARYLHHANVQRALDHLEYPEAMRGLPQTDMTIIKGATAIRLWPSITAAEL